ncbi:MAG TPA: selenocysteine-specific translation elongation factor [Desulfitobacterium dehalogenans]|uniref:Selenocysteine-specific elongation factor n=1 Tax=Desulfitobacterium dehalogenans TaxID=36854 RepID=A0A7C7DCR1_9FIRM|nr:selenocysteine-specific translation elongation factor [Desulfitobacterium dehalogenans]
MNNIIIGTAGHIDHGKTALIKALTGKDTDWLKEEKKRGITIDLGFAYLPFEDGSYAGVIDVPGHEKFIKNMLAGVGGIDIVLLVVAADDGVMPQTREHLDILNLLEIKAGIVVITKCDLVDEDWLSLVKEDINSAVKGTFLEDAPLLSVSSHTGAGLDELKKAINTLAKSVQNKDIYKPWRLPVDRVFTIDGFGTVVTGTLVEGTLTEGDEALIYPSGLKSRVRNLQVHSNTVSKAYAGQRVAINLAGVRKTDLLRGDVVAEPGSLKNSTMADVKLSILKDAQRVVKNGSRVHFYHGTRDVLCKVVLLDADELKPGEQGFAQLRFAEEVAVKQGDHYIVRFYSPVETIGGGIIINGAPSKHHRNNRNVLESLAALESGSDTDRLLQEIREGAKSFKNMAVLKKDSGLDEKLFLQQLDSLAKEGRVFLMGDVPMDTMSLDELYEKAKKFLSSFHMKNPLKAGMKIDKYRATIAPGQKAAVGDAIIAYYKARNLLKTMGDMVSLPDYESRYSDEQIKLKKAIEAVYEKALFQPPEEAEVVAMFKNKDTEALLDVLIDEDVLVVGTEQLYFHKKAMEKAREVVESLVNHAPSFTLAEFRDATQSSRKYALIILDYLDRTKITKKVGDARVLLKQP